MLHSTYKFTYLENIPHPFYKGRSNCKLRNETVWIAVKFLWPLSRTTARVTSDRPKNELCISSYTNDNKNSITAHTIIDFVYAPYFVWFPASFQILSLFLPTMVLYDSVERCLSVNRQWQCKGDVYICKCRINPVDLSRNLYPSLWSTRVWTLQWLSWSCAEFSDWVKPSAQKVQYCAPGRKYIKFQKKG